LVDRVEHLSHLVGYGGCAAWAHSLDLNSDAGCSTPATRRSSVRTDASVEQVAGSCGMGTATTLRRHFHRAVGVTPTSYRASFQLT
jgi:hypothetical protein